MYLELGTGDSVRAGPTAVLVKEAEVSDCLRGSRSLGVNDFVSGGARLHDPIMETFSVIPRPKVSGPMIEPY